MPLAAYAASASSRERRASAAAPGIELADEQSVESDTDERKQIQNIGRGQAKQRGQYRSSSIFVRAAMGAKMCWGVLSIRSKRLWFTFALRIDQEASFAISLMK